MRGSPTWRILTVMAALFATQACSSSDDTPPPGGEDARSDVSVDASADASLIDGSPKDAAPEAEDARNGNPLEAADGPGDSGDVGADANDDRDAGSPGCSDDLGCSGATPRCHLGTHSCVACLTGATDNCSDGQYCDPNLFSCKAGCKSSASCMTGVCSADHVCVECTPGANDACPAGKYCGPQFSCIPGCKNDLACQSGRCQASHDCASCLSDQECAAGRVCSSGQCLDPCMTASPNCPQNFACCVDHCADMKRDFRHCGACDTACTSGQFCSPTGCKTPVLANVCDSPTATFLQDGLALDDAAATTIQTAILASCAPPPAATAVAQASSSAINPTTGRPVAGGGNMLVVAGGPFGQQILKYLEMAKITPIYSYYDPLVNQLRGRAPGDGGADPAIVDAPQSSITDSHSFFVVEMVVDPGSGTLALVMYGVSGSGTQAGAWYFAQKMLPMRASLDKTWYVYEWTDQDANLAPGDADTFTLVASSP